jgi:hypothetical protein
MDKSKEFQLILRSNLIPFLESKNYVLEFDNSKIDEKDDSRWVFKLVFNGENKIEISNDDWRDYTEYFQFYKNSKNIFTTNVENYSDLQKCYKQCEYTLSINL